eukprot:3521408-Rhodomonas_salina.1
MGCNARAMAKGRRPREGESQKSKVRKHESKILEEMFGLDRMSIELRSRRALCALRMCGPEPSQ